MFQLYFNIIGAHVKSSLGIIDAEEPCDMSSEHLDNGSDIMHISGDPPYTCDPSPLR